MNNNPINIQETDLSKYGISGTFNTDDGIGILVDMVKQGKIDPWNIDIVQVADQFSAHVFQSKAQNLRYTSRVILYAAILLKMKSDILEGIDITDIVPQDAPDVEGLDDGFMPEENPEDFVPTNNVISFDEVLERRTSVRLNRNRVVTLRDLVRQLEFYAQLDKKASIENAKQRARRVKSYKRLRGHQSRFGCFKHNSFRLCCDKIF